MVLTDTPLSLFTAVGIEIEYMIVNQHSLEVLPAADLLIHDFVGHVTNEIELGDIALSNELVKHVIELKTNGPKPLSPAIQQQFHHTITSVNHRLKKHDAMLLPTGIHPWFNPEHGVELWNHGDRAIYHAYDKIFSCRGHGWANLQSTHLNLPFANDDEFNRLHQAIRLVLPIIPALTASSPIVEGRPAPWLDARLSYYLTNQQKVPLIIGELIPEHIISQQEYVEKILQPIYLAITPFDDTNILQHEWLNSRAAIARFERMAIEIRVLDTQEAPVADMLFVHYLHQLLRWVMNAQQQRVSQPLPAQQLKKIFIDCAQAGSRAIISDSDYLQQLGLVQTKPISAQELNLFLLESMGPSYFSNDIYMALQQLFSLGTLAERILTALNQDYSKQNLTLIYRELARCLANNQLFGI